MVNWRIDEEEKIGFLNDEERRFYLTPLFSAVSGVTVQPILSPPKTPDFDANSEEKSETNSVDANTPVDKSNQKEQNAAKQ